MEELVERIVPKSTTFVEESDFRVEPEKLRRTKLILDIIGIVSVVIVIVCIWVGVL